MAFRDTRNLKPFENKVWLSSPTMHGPELTYMQEAYETNWMSTVGKNINDVEAQMAEYVGVKYAVALSAGTAALHLATKLAGEKLYGQAQPNEGTLQGKNVLLIYDNNIIGIIVPQSLAAQRFAGFLRGLKKLKKSLRPTKESLSYCS